MACRTRTRHSEADHHGTRTDLGLLALRLATGGVLAAHGAQKLLGWFGGHGIEGTGRAMEQMGFVPGRPSAMAAGLCEAGGGALLALGLATPAAGAAASGAMAGAVAVHAPQGFFSVSGGYEYPALLGAAAGALGLAGPGRYSVDHLTGHSLDQPWLIALAFTGTGAATAAIIRRRNAAVRAKADAAAAADADASETTTSDTVSERSRHHAHHGARTQN